MGRVRARPEGPKRRGRVEVGVRRCDEGLSPCNKECIDVGTPGEEQDNCKVTPVWASCNDEGQDLEGDKGKGGEWWKIMGYTT